MTEQFLAVTTRHRANHLQFRLNALANQSGMEIVCRGRTRTRQTVGNRQNADIVGRLKHRHGVEGGPSRLARTIPGYHDALAERLHGAIAGQEQQWPPGFHRQPLRQIEPMTERIREILRRRDDQVGGMTLRNNFAERIHILGRAASPLMGDLLPLRDVFEDELDGFRIPALALIMVSEHILRNPLRRL